MSCMAALDCPTTYFHDVQALAAHDDFLRRVMKGTLLSRKVKVLQRLSDLKGIVHRRAGPSLTNPVCKELLTDCL